MDVHPTIHMVRLAHAKQNTHISGIQSHPQVVILKTPAFFRAKIPIGIITIWINNVIIRQPERNIPIKFIPLQIQGTSRLLKSAVLKG